MPATDYTMDDFRAEMKRRGVPDKPLRLRTPHERAKRARGRRGGRRESWKQFVERLLVSCRARLAVYEQRSPADVIPCPWGAVFGGECLAPCRCDGRREVTVGFMVAHYRLTIELYTPAKESR